jgi:hypothetical protein
MSQKTELVYPAFYAEVPRIRLRDPLAEFLGAAQGGLLEYGYLDAVKLAGHSCPTVAAAYGLTRCALRALYGDEVPMRGGLRVTFAERADKGVTGVIANVVSLLTGAAGEGGFKGLAGRFSRCNLLAFGAVQPLEIRYTRIDNGCSVDTAADLSGIPAAAEMGTLLQRCLAGVADASEQQAFGQLWQDRVRRILLDHADDPAVFVVRVVRPA